MVRKFFSFGLALIVIFMSSCATIVSKSSYPISIQSAPSDAKIVIKDRNDNEFFSGQTPANLLLKSGDGFFKKARYSVTFSKDGFQTKTVPIEFSLDGWYFGNILIGGVIGMLIIDPATGAMYKLNTDYISETLVPSTASVDHPELNIYTVNEIPENWKGRLVLIDN